MAKEVHYKDAGTWRKAKEIWYQDAGVWRKLKELWYRDQGVWQKVFSSFAVALTGGGTLYSHGEDGSAQTTLTVNTDGTMVINGDFVTNLQWGDPTTAGVGANYWVRFTCNSNSNSGSGGTATFTPSTDWLQLNAARGVVVAATKSVGSGTRTSIAFYTVEIATDSSGTNIVGVASGYQLRAIAIAII